MNERLETKGRRDGLYLPLSTIVRVLLVLLFISIIKVIAPLIMTLFLASLLAVSLFPVADWLTQKGMRRGVAVGLIALTLVAVGAAVTALIVPKLFEEFSNFFTHLPELKDKVLSALPEGNPLRPVVQKFLTKPPEVSNPATITPIFNVGNMALGGLTETLLIFVFSIYLLIDGRSTLEWCGAFFSRENQTKIRQMGEEISPIVFSYVAGQLITSLLSFFYVLIALSLLHVPNALLLAVLSGLFDILPVLGFFLAVIPAVLFAFSVSGTTALIVVFLYLFYHAIENYYVVPAVYGNRLRVSSFVVLVTLIAAGLLAGIEGAIAVLPIVASYPVIERLWLKPIVGQKTIAEHNAIDAVDK